MRIIGGTARGRKLVAPEGTDTRPTTDRIRETLFNVLGQRCDGERVLDLFGGTGALALEAVSRGADFALIADIGQKQIACIRRNAEGVAGKEPGRVMVKKCDYRDAIATAPGRYSLIFMDPPYRMTEVYADAATRLLKADRLTEDARIVMEFATGVQLKLPEEFEAVDTRRYGDTSISIVRLKAACTEEEHES